MTSRRVLSPHGARREEAGGTERAAPTLLHDADAVPGRGPAGKAAPYPSDPGRVCAPEAVMLLQPQAGRDDRSVDRGPHGATRARREADALVQRLEPVGQLDLVALSATEELDAHGALLGRSFDRVQRCDEPRREPAERRVEREAMHVHAALEEDVVVERGGTPGHLEREDSRAIELGETSEGVSVECLADRRRELGAVRPVFPAEVVEPERDLEVTRELVGLPRDADGEAALGIELLPAAPMQVAPLRRRLLAVDLVPAAREIDHGSFDALDR